MSQEQVLKTLLGLGLTRLDSQVYIYLAKKGPQKGRDLLRGLRIQRQQLYRSLKNLQSKGIVSATFEHPAGFSAISFDKVVDLFIKSKMVEAQLIQEKKGEILSSWKSIALGEATDPDSKFTVIEGRGYIYSKILQMVKETKDHLSTITSVAGLLRADQFGIFDEILAHPLKEKVNFKFISEITSQNVGTTQKLLERIPKNSSNIRGRNPDFGFSLSPRMVVRDDEELFLFINPLAKEPLEEKDDVGLWTNCQTIVQSFSAMFEELWRNSNDMTKMAQEATSSQTRMKPFSNSELELNKYSESLLAATEEIMIMTSSQGLNVCLKNLPLFSEISQRNVSFRIMAPLLNDNFEAAKKLSKICEVRHIPTNYAEVTVIDGKNLYQFKGFNNNEKIGFSKDEDLVTKTKNRLAEIWKKATPLSNNTLESLIGPYGCRPTDLIKRNRNFDNIQFIEENEKITEKEIVEKIFKAKRIPIKDISKDLHIMYATGGSAVVHPPEVFNLPDLMFEVQHIDKHSGFGQGDALVVFCWLKTPIGYAFVPAGGIGDNPKGVAFRKAEFAGFPAEENYRLVKKDVLQIHAHGNTLFAGWTIPITLSSRYILPPATLLIEGYGDVKTKGYTTVMLSGFRNKTEINGFDAFVTFTHPASNYSGPGTDGFFVRDLVVTMTPPREGDKSKVKELEKKGNTVS